MEHQLDISQIYAEHGKTVFRFLLRLSHDEELSKELTQDTFVRAMESVDRFDGSCKLTTWLCQIAKNLYYDHLKYQSRHGAEPLPEDDVIPAQDRPLEELLCDADLARHIRLLVHTLSEPYKEVFLLRVYAELPFKEIGLMFEKSEVWGRVTFLRAKEMILKKLEKTNNL